jgi:hypothetical protein
MTCASLTQIFLDSKNKYVHCYQKSIEQKWYFKTEERIIKDSFNF